MGIALSMATKFDSAKDSFASLIFSSCERIALLGKERSYAPTTNLDQRLSIWPQL